MARSRTNRLTWGLALLIGPFVAFAAVFMIIGRKTVQPERFADAARHVDGRVATAPAAGDASLVHPSTIESAPLRTEVSEEMIRTERFAKFTRAELEDRIRVLEAELERKSDLERALEEQRRLEKSTQAPSWSAARLIGPPNANPNQDDVNAWASARADMGMQWIDLGFGKPMRVESLRIFEVCVAGAVVQIDGVTESGARRRLWAGHDPLTEPGVFEVPIRTMREPMSRIRIHLDTNAHSGWNEIDAVELVGPDGRAWVNDATASSCFGENQLQVMPLIAR